MGTRSGDIDPAIMEFIAKKENLDIAGVMNVLNKKSGVQGISGLSSDFRDLEEGMEAGNERATADYRSIQLPCSKIHWFLCSSNEWCRCDRIYSRNR